MLISFSISNFRSFSSEETLSLVASNRLSGKHEGHAINIPGSKEKVLKTTVIYGANGAGKSNLFKALRYLKSIALYPRKKNTGTGRVAFRFNNESDITSNFDLQFTTGDKFYRFGFKADDTRIIEEWLVQVIGNKEKPLYERITDEKGKVTIEAPYLKKVGGEKLAALTTVGSPQNQSFLSTINATLEISDFGEELTNILTWFTKGLNLIAPNEPIGSLGHLLSRDSDFREFAGNFLKSSSTGVEHLDVNKKEIKEEELRSLLPTSLADKVLEDISKGENKGSIVHLGEGNEILIEKTDENHYYSISIQAAHKQKMGEAISFDLSDESDGTQRLLNLMPALHHLRNDDAVYFIDEIDRSMHPMLIWKFLEFFLKSCGDGQRQIIVTTHETNLLNLDLLRRDEIWFTEKDENNATHLYSMSEYKVRNDLEISKHYLQGRFGAVPFLGNIDRLLTEEVQCK